MFLMSMRNKESLYIRSAAGDVQTCDDIEPKNAVHSDF